MGACYSSGQTKLTFLNKASDKLELAKFFLYLAWDMGVLHNENYISLSEKIDEAGKMLGGWKRKLLKQTSAIKAEERK